MRYSVSCSRDGHSIPQKFDSRLRLPLRMTLGVKVAREFGHAPGCISVGGDVPDAPCRRKELFDCTKIVCVGRVVEDVDPYKIISENPPKFADSRGRLSLRTYPNRATEFAGDHIFRLCRNSRPYGLTTECASEFAARCPATAHIGGRQSQSFMV